jgi:nucleoside-diphosphate-sugar epimerase
MSERGTVLVTGGSGFIGGWCIIRLLEQGYSVRTTLRSLSRREKLRALIASQVDPGDRLNFFGADLLSDEGWREAAAGADYVLHVASPVPTVMPRRADSIIVPARDGTLRVLKAAKAAGVKRVVVTSSMAAIAYGHKGAPGAPYTEATWTNLEAKTNTPYVRSKTVAERAAWDWIAKFGAGMELTTINPGLVLGPALSDDTSASLEVIKKLLVGALPGCPRIGFAVVDVRDVADLHVRAMTAPEAAGQRFLATGPFLWMEDVAKILRDRLGPDAKRVPTKKLPGWMLRAAALADPVVRSVVSELDRERACSSEKARTVLGWTPRPPEEAIVAAAESLIRLGALRAPTPS